MEKRTLVVVDSFTMAKEMRGLVREDVEVMAPGAATMGRRFDRVVVVSYPETDEPRLRELFQRWWDEQLRTRLSWKGTLVLPPNLPTWLRLNLE